MVNERHIAILGAGPTGLEAARAASECGLPFTVYEAGARMGEPVRRRTGWQQVDDFFGRLVS
jgi:NADPH-dependent 2,4-dienoyl-CoA reductase/sulfur reductase-like enzyme